MPLKYSLTVVIPAFNEEGNLKRLLMFLEQTFQMLKYKLPTLIIDDGSEDKSPQILQALEQKYDFLKVIRHPENLGVTQVWITALENVKTDWIFWGQADLESDPRIDLPLLINAVTEEVDAVAGWRQNRGDKKTLTSKIANKACQLAFGLKVHDMNWIKLVRRDALIKLPIKLITHRYLLAVMSGLGYKIKEVPTPWYPRYSGVSKFGKSRLVTSGKDFLIVLWWFYILRNLKLFDPSGIFLRNFKYKNPYVNKK